MIASVLDGYENERKFNDKIGMTGGDFSTFYDGLTDKQFYELWHMHAVWMVNNMNVYIM